MKTTIAAAILASALGASFAMAQDVSSPGATRPIPPYDQLAAAKLSASLEHRGITGITSVRHAGDGFLVTAIRNTQPVTVWVDPQSGDIQVKNQRY